MTNDDVRTEFAAAVTERLEVCAELAHVGVELQAVERRFGALPEIVEARQHHQALCVMMLDQLQRLMLGNDRPVVH